jgi:hypothetical protein
MYREDPYATEGKPGPFSPLSAGKGAQAGKPAPTNRYGPYYAAADAYGQTQRPQPQRMGMGRANPLSAYGDYAQQPNRRGMMQRPPQRPQQWSGYGGMDPSRGATSPRDPGSISDPFRRDGGY